MRSFDNSIHGFSLNLLACIFFSFQSLAAPQSLKTKPVGLISAEVNPTSLTSSDRIKTLGPAILADDSFVIKDAVLTHGIDLTIQIPRNLFTLPKSFEDRSNDVLRASLPNTLQQFSFSSDEIPEAVDAGVPLLMNAIQELLSEEQPTANGLHRRSFLGDVLGWAKDAGCALVAAAGLPIFLLAAADFGIENTDGKHSLSSIVSIVGVAILFSRRDAGILKIHQGYQPRPSKIFSSFQCMQISLTMGLSQFIMQLHALLFSRELLVRHSTEIYSPPLLR